MISKVVFFSKKLLRNFNLAHDKGNLEEVIYKLYRNNQTVSVLILSLPASCSFN